MAADCVIPRLGCWKAPARVEDRVCEGSNLGTTEIVIYEMRYNLYQPYPWYTLDEAKLKLDINHGELVHLIRDPETEAPNRHSEWKSTH